MLYREYLDWQELVFKVLRNLKGATYKQISHELAVRGLKPSKSRLYAFLRNDPSIKKYKIWSYSNENMYCLEYIEAPRRQLIVQYNEVLQAFNQHVKYGYDSFTEFMVNNQSIFNANGYATVASNTNSHAKLNKKEPDNDASLWVARRNKMSFVMLQGKPCFLLFDSQAMDSKAYFNRFNIVEKISSLLDCQIGIVIVGSNPEKVSRIMKRKYGKKKMEELLREYFNYVPYVLYLWNNETIEIYNK